MRNAWQKSPESGAATPTYEDLRIESAIFSYVAAHGGERLTIPQLVRDLAHELGEETGSAIERGVRELVRARILCCDGAFVREVQ